jgi:hypothetical protein
VTAEEQQQQKENNNNNNNNKPYSQKPSDTITTKYLVRHYDRKTGVMLERELGEEIVSRRYSTAEGASILDPRDPYSSDVDPLTIARQQMKAKNKERDPVWELNQTTIPQKI